MDHDELIAAGKAISQRNRIEREKLRRQLAERIEAANKEVARLVDLFCAEDPSLETVILFGSLAEGRVRSLRFDIDLAVDCDRYYHFVALALDSPFAVDVIDLRTASRYVRDAVSRSGKVLYDKKQARV